MEMATKVKAEDPDKVAQNRKVIQPAKSSNEPRVQKHSSSGSVVETHVTFVACAATVTECWHIKLC